MTREQLQQLPEAELIEIISGQQALIGQLQARVAQPEEQIKRLTRRPKDASNSSVPPSKSAKPGRSAAKRNNMHGAKPGDPQRLLNFYEGRGHAENHVEELKNWFKADSLSCSRSEASAFRLVLFVLAYQLVNLFRQRLSNPELRRAQLQTLRERVFKVGALIKQSPRRFWLHLASAWPYQGLLAGALNDIGVLPAPT